MDRLSVGIEASFEDYVENRPVSSSANPLCRYFASKFHQVNAVDPTEIVSVPSIHDFDQSIFDYHQTDTKSR